MVHDNPLLSAIFNIIFSQTRIDSVLLQWYIILRRHIKRDASLDHNYSQNGKGSAWDSTQPPLPFHHNKEHKGEMHMSIQPFTINISQATLDDLRDRLAHTRWPDEAENSGWTHG